MSAAEARHELPFLGALLLWLLLLIIGVFGGHRFGLGGREFDAALLVASVLLAGEIFLACPRTFGRVAGFFRGRMAYLALLLPLAAFLFYAAAGYPLGLPEVVGGIFYVAVPALFAASARGKSPGAWQDYAAVLAIWLPIELGRPVGAHILYKLWPSPAPLTHTLTILFAVDTAIAVFLIVRRFDGVGYAAEWRRGFGPTIAIHFAILAAILIPIGEAIHFIHFGPTRARIEQMPFTGLGILIFTAWPEEFLFRGILQNLLSRSLKNRDAGWIAASVIFGFSHIFHAPIPNGKYVFLATIAGLFYGRAWMKTDSLTPGAMIHMLVDTIWFGFFPR